ncbi:hypothetical protein ABZ553_01850 [Streptomyces sparsogenes]|uniref:hypothetical protein n=1 Tax=Streptomyces sparsogenes TaxID=67365 RepID=UPI003402E5FD
MSEWFLQREYGVRFEWGPVGARRLAPEAACLVVVDVLSFTTSVTVAVEAGTRVFPYAWRDETAAAFAREKAADLAVGRRAAESRGLGPLSPEAAAARSAFAGTPDVAGAVAACSSGIELAEGGFAEDVAIAVELNASGVVPVLTQGTFDASPERWRGHGGS